MSESQVLSELNALKGDKVKLMEKYTGEMQAILNLHGGNPSDVPANAEHPYHKLQHKLMILGRMK